MSGNVLRPGLRNPTEDEICDVSFSASPAACVLFDLLHPQKKQIQNQLNQLETRVFNKKPSNFKWVSPTHAKPWNWNHGLMCVMRFALLNWSFRIDIDGPSPPRISPFVSGPDHWKLSCHVLSSSSCLGLLEVPIKPLASRGGLCKCHCKAKDGSKNWGCPTQAECVLFPHWGKGEVSAVCWFCATMEAN